MFSHGAECDIVGNILGKLLEFFFLETVYRRCLQKSCSHKFQKISLEKTCAGIPIVIRKEPSNMQLFWKRDCGEGKFWEIFKKTYFVKNLRAAGFFFLCRSKVFVVFNLHNCNSQGLFNNYIMHIGCVGLSIFRDVVWQKTRGGWGRGGGGEGVWVILHERP